MSSQLDADRFDYLLRDSLFTGVGYGQFDLNWLIDHLYVNEDKGFFLSYKALLPAEQYIFARYHMYRIVYFHKTTRAAEVMLRLIFDRYKTLLQSCDSTAKKRAIVADAPSRLVNAFSGQIGLADYIALDDHVISAFLHACESASDKVLQELSSGLLNRKLYKAKDVTDAMREKMDAVLTVYSKISEKVRADGEDPESILAQDRPADNPYKAYDPTEEEPARCIFVQNTLGQVREISRVSDPVRELTERYSLLRWYFPERLRDDVENIWKAEI